MAEPQNQNHPVERPATLELEDGARLGGQLSALPGNRLQMSSTRLIRKPADGSAPMLQAGVTAVLKLAPLEPSEHNLKPCSVKLEAVGRDALSLKLVNPEDDGVRRCLGLLARGPAEAPHPAAPTAERPVAAPEPSAAEPVARQGQTEITLRSMRGHSLAEMERRLKPFFSDLANYLFDLSTQVRHSSSEQNIFYDATVAVRRNRDIITAAIIKRLDDLYDTPLLLRAGSATRR